MVGGVYVRGARIRFSSGKVPKKPFFVSFVVVVVGLVVLGLSKISDSQIETFS